MNKDFLIAQVIGSGADHLNMIRQEDLQKTLTLINADEAAEMAVQDKNFAAALVHMQKVQEFIDHPEHILGSRSTKHGEIAEQIEVGITNAEAALRGIEERAVIDPEIVGRTVNAPVDYYIDGIPVQSKYIATRYGELYHILEHFKKYGNEQFDVAGGGFVHCPPEYMETFIDILSKSPENLNNEEKTLLNKIHEIELRTGKKFEEVVRPGRPSYEDVQLSNAPDTVKRYTEELVNDNEQIKAGISEKAEQKRTVAIEEQAPSLAEAGKVAAIGATMSGGITLTIDIYKKRKEGKKISEFDAEDWKELGLDTGKSSLKGGVTGTSVYALTNLANMRAPIATGYTSATFGVLDLLNECRKGEIDFATFIDMSEVLCTETAITTIGSTIGQMIIPIPVVGAVVGSVSINILGDIIKEYGTSEEEKLIQKAVKRQKEEMTRLSFEHQEYIERIDAECGKIRYLQNKTFDMTLDSESRFDYSRQLAVKCGVAPEDIFHSIDDIDAYFLGEEDVRNLQNETKEL